MITIDTVVSAKKQYVIDNVMPSDLDNDLEEGLKKKEELISKITNESVVEANPDIMDTIAELNASGITEDDYYEFIKGTTKVIDKIVEPDPAKPSIQYCIDNQSLKKYEKNSTIELKIPEGEGVEKKVTISTLTKLSGEYVDTYWTKNAYWSIIPKDTTEPDVPDFLQIHYKGSVVSKDELLDIGACGKINFIRNGFTWSSVDNLNSVIEKDGSVDVSGDELSSWVKNGLLPSTQKQIPNFKMTINMNEGDMMYVQEDHLNYIFHEGQWEALPKGMSDLRQDATNQFVSVKTIEFSEENAKGDEDTECCTGGHYCITTQYQSSKFQSVDTNTFVYLHLTAKKQQEKKQKSCSKSNNCSKQSSACDKGQTDEADQHNPNVNENWLNQILDLLIKVELHPMQKSLRDLAEAILALCNGEYSLSSAPARGTCPDGPVSGNVVCPDAAGQAAAAQAKAELVLAQITPRSWYNTVLTGTGDIAVDISTSIIFDAAESAVNAAVDAAISEFNDMVNDTVNQAVTNAMDAADSCCGGCCGGAKACAAACSAAGNAPLAAAVNAACSSCQGACNAALSKCNEECLNTTKNLLGEFSQSICDTRMQDTGDESSLSALMDTIASAGDEASGGAISAAADLASSYLSDVNSACDSLNSIVSQAYSIIGE